MASTTGSMSEIMTRTFAHDRQEPKVEENVDFGLQTTLLHRYKTSRLMHS